MNRFVLYIIFLSLSLKTIAQENLIYNGSFEEYYSCPTGNDLNDGQLELAKGWWKPTLGTSDYFNACNTTYVGVPTNLFGYQESFEGNAYVGFGVAWDSLSNYLGFEYIQSQLTEILKPCYRYKICFWVSLAEASTHGVSKIGMLFSPNKFNSDSVNFANVSSISTAPQFVNNSNPIIDTSNWIKVEGDFVADGTEEYVTIGYFFPTIQNDTSFVQNHISNSYVFYYYIDSVSLIEIGEVSENLCHVPEITLPNVITANNDGVNDVLSIAKWLGFHVEVRIYNRWGNEVALLNDDNPIWNGANCSDGVYFYKLTYELDNKTKQQSGFIQLIR